MSDVVHDALARRRAQQEFERPVVLEAGAGTGKTAALTGRILAWGLGPGWVGVAAKHPGAPLEQVASRVFRGVLAITFTEAAAAEMAERVGEALAAMAAGSTPAWFEPPPGVSPEEARARAGFLLTTLDHLTVSTIHAYCLGLLREHALAAGLHPAFTVDGDAAAVRAAIGEEIAAWLPTAAGRPEVERLVAAGRSPASLARALERLIAGGAREEHVYRADFGIAWQEEVQRLRAALEALRTAGTGFLRWVDPRSFVTLAVLEALEATEKLLAAHPHHDPTELCDRLRALWRESCWKRLCQWGEGSWNVSETKVLGTGKEAITRAAASVVTPLKCLLSARPQETAAAAQVLAELLSGVRERLRRAGVVTFDDLLFFARRLLETNSAVAARERARWRQVLVDEFQDTDQEQCALLAQLCLAGPTRERPGLFVVGDPKQSIYAWRSADLAAYQDFLERVRRAGGKVYTLCVNFRSVPAILKEVETALAPVMTYELGVQAAFQPLLPSQARRGAEGFRRGRWAPVEYWHTPPLGPGESAAMCAARAVAADLLALHESGVAWESVGILLRTTGELETYLEALREAGVPFTAARDRGYYRRREVIEAAALLRAAADPTDHVALLGWLRSPLVGVPDAALLPLWRAGLPGLLTDLTGPEHPGLGRLEGVVKEAAAQVPTDVPGIERMRGWEAALLASVRQLAEFRWWLEREPFPAWLERVRQETWLEVGEAARYLGAVRLANLEQLFLRLEKAVERAGGDRRAVLAALRRALAEESEGEGGRPERGSGGVRIMTVHGAKGLDFDHVFLVQAHQGARREGADENAVVRSGPRLFLKLLGLPWPSWQDGERIRRAVRRAELVRTLYVAMTRARERLVVVGDWEARTAQGDDSYLALLHHRRPAPLFSSVPPESRWAFEDVEGVRWVFPQIPPSLYSAPPARPAQAFHHDLEDATRLQKLAKEVWQRAARARAGTITAEAHRGEEGRWRTGGERASGSSVAAAAGTVVHAVLERLDLTQALLPQLEDWEKDVDALLPSDVAEIERTAAAALAVRVLSGLRQSPLADRLAAVAPAVVGREVPVLLPGTPEGDGPLGYLTGAVDLLYRDPHLGTWVVADFKTDAVETAEEMAQAAASYRRQGELYCRAVKEALRLSTSPHFELWFLQAGQVVRLW